MQRTTQTITVFFSTTNDPTYAARRKAFNRVIRMVQEARNVSIKVLDWQENIPGGVSRTSGQARINDEVRDTFDVYFGCLGTSFGSGTVEECENAIRGHIAKGRPTEVLFAFDATPVDPFAIPIGFDKVVNFKTDIQSDTKYGRSILYFAFSDLERFEELAFRDLNAAVKKAQSRIRGGMPGFN